MTKLAALLAAVAFCVAGVAYGDNSLVSLDQFDRNWGVVFPAERARDLMQFDRSDAEGTWTPTARDIATLEPLLAGQFSRTRDSSDAQGMALPGLPKNFYRQYGGVVVHGRRLIVVNGFHKYYVAEVVKAGAPADFWKRDVVAVKDGGCFFFHADFDVAAGKVLHLSCQGYA